MRGHAGRSKGDVDLLLGQTFIEHVKYTMRSGKLIIERLDTAEPAGDAQAAAGTETNKATKAATREAGAVRPPRAAVKSKRSTQNRPAASGGDAQAPPDGGPDPN